MFFFNINFYIFIFSHILYYSNYIIIYVLAYFFLIKNGRFKKFIYSFWNSYQQEKLLAKNNLDDKSNSLNNLHINLQNRLHQYHLLVKKCEYIKQKKNSNHEKQDKLDCQKKYQTYIEESQKKILENEKKNLIYKYTKKIILNKIKLYDDFFFIKQIKEIERGER